MENIKSKKPYLIRAIYEWCCDNELTPQIIVQFDKTVIAPSQHVQDGVIVLNISKKATANMDIGSHLISFKTRFSGTVWDICVPISRVIGVFSRETGEGIPLPLEEAVVLSSDSDLPKNTSEKDLSKTNSDKSSHTTLRLVK
jgi:stringent starvation protein B